MAVKRLGVPLAIALVLVGCIATPEPIQPPSSGPDRAAAPSATPDVASAPATVPSADAGDASDGPDPSVPTSAVTAPPITTQACLLETQPGPADAAPTAGDLTDWSHIFGGRARLCVGVVGVVGGAAPVEVEGTAWCTWSGTFDHVTTVSLLPRPVDATTGDLDAGLSFEPPGTFVSGTAPDGQIGSWEGGLRREDVRVEDHGRRGIVRLDVAALQPDPERPLPLLPPNVVGLLRWSCLAPVAP